MKTRNIIKYIDSSVVIWQLRKFVKLCAKQIFPNVCALLQITGIKDKENNDYINYVAECIERCKYRNPILKIQE